MICEPTAHLGWSSSSWPCQFFFWKFLKGPQLNFSLINLLTVRLKFLKTRKIQKISNHKSYHTRCSNLFIICSKRNIIINYLIFTYKTIINLQFKTRSSGLTCLKWRWNFFCRALLEPGVALRMASAAAAAAVCWAVNSVASVTCAMEGLLVPLRYNCDCLELNVQQFYFECSHNYNKMLKNIALKRQLKQTRNVITFYVGNSSKCGIFSTYSESIFCSITEQNVPEICGNSAGSYSLGENKINSPIKHTSKNGSFSDLWPLCVNFFYRKMCISKRVKDIILKFGNMYLRKLFSTNQIFKHFFQKFQNGYHFNFLIVSNWILILHFIKFDFLTQNVKHFLINC